MTKRIFARKMAVEQKKTLTPAELAKVGGGLPLRTMSTCGESGIDDSDVW